ncbi:early nodulin-75-like [Durio zibethinus]|uniref:Early nodulin-75-like n=1 Tax=Durio zibethinus TaxID=66656 RepID=A0A6P6A813_DURZI|nr:early nodulin-75-like [Durio zibethinus]
MSKAYLLLLFLGVMVLLTTPFPSLAFNGPPKEDDPFPERKPPITPKNEEPPKQPGDCQACPCAHAGSDNKPVAQPHLLGHGVEDSDDPPSKPFGKGKPPKGKGKKPPLVHHSGHLLSEEVYFQPPRKLNQAMLPNRPPVPPYQPPNEPPHRPPHEPPHQPPNEPPHEPPHEPPSSPLMSLHMSPP